MNALEELTAAGGQLSQFFTDAYLAQARAYAEPLRIEAVVGMAWDLVQYLVILGLGLHTGLYRWCERHCAAVAALFTPGGPADRLRRVFERVWRGPGMGAAALFIALLQTLRNLVNLPEEIYFGFIREKQHGMTTYTVGGWLYDQLKTNTVGLFIFVVMLLALYALMRWMPRRWALVMASVSAVVMLGAALVDPYRAKLVYDYKPLPEGPLRTAIIDTLKRGQVEFGNVVVQNLSRSSVRGDAFFAGQGPTRVIVIGDTLLGRYTPAELSTIVAHEMGHLSEPVWVGKLLSGAAVFFGILAMGWLLATAGKRHWFGLQHPADVTGYILVVFAYFLVTSAADPVSNARSRQREAEADQYALQLTRDPQSFTSMMAKLSAQNRSDPTPWGWYEWWFWDHPAPARRLAHALRFAREQSLPLTFPPPQDATPIAAR